jgi:hypothetical protein
LGSPGTYRQEVYSGIDSSFSTTVFHSGKSLNVKNLVNEAAVQMATTVKKRSGQNPTVNSMNADVLHKIDRRLLFLTYISYEDKKGIQVEGSGAIQKGNCWSVVRFSRANATTRNVALDQFRFLIRNTRLEG